MTKIILKKQEVELTPKTNPLNAFEELGVNFSCHTGICGICKIKIKKGEKNINPKTSAEEDYPLNKKERLACQCTKIKGDIEIENAEW